MKQGVTLVIALTMVFYVPMLYYTLSSNGTRENIPGRSDYNITELSDILSTSKHQLKSAGTPLEKEPDRGGKPIIFLETRCVLNGSNTNNETGLIISQRGACAVESAAKTNPNSEVYLIYTCPIIGTPEDSREYVKQMLSYPNVRIWKLVISEFINGTPLENWDFMGKVMSSKWPIVHASDILRLLALWKYGGTYLDLDFVILKSLFDLGNNYAGAQSKDYVANGALNFDMDVAGRTVADLCINDIQNNFNGNSWGHNGPEVITRALQNMCGTANVSDKTREECKGFTVLPSSIFYAIFYTSWRKFYVESWSNYAMKS